MHSKDAVYMSDRTAFILARIMHRIWLKRVGKYGSVTTKAWHIVTKSSNTR